MGWGSRWVMSQAVWRLVWRCGLVQEDARALLSHCNE